MRTFFPRERRLRVVALEKKEVLKMITQGIAIVFCVHIASSECRRAVCQAVFRSFKISSLEVGTGNNPVQILVKAEFPQKHHPPRVSKLGFGKIV